MPRGNFHHSRIECPICGKIVGVSGALTAHMRAHIHKGEAKESSDCLYGDIRRFFHYGPNFSKKLRVR